MLDLKPKFIDTGTGEQLVILTHAEYEALLNLAASAEEDADDVALFDARMADLGKKPHATLPADVNASLLRGDRLLKALRNFKGLTQVQLAQRANLTQGYLSDLESGRRAGTKETLLELARALDVDPSWLVSEG
jgi:DNA-binding XRE family transcriptional regulator